MGLRTQAFGGRLRSSMAESGITGSLRDPAVAARFLGWAYVAGTMMAALSMLVPQPPGTDVMGLFALYAASLLVGAALLLRGDRVNETELSLALLTGTALITLAIHFTEDRSGVYSMLYVWVALESVSFLPRRHAVLQFVAMSAGFALVLAAERPAGAEEQWFVTVGTIIVVGVLVDALKAHVEGLVGGLADAAHTDPLTELRNRRGFQEILAAELGRTSRTGRPASLLVADLDHFKLVNDSLGHAGGDRALRRFADQMRRLTREIDTPARLGGEEFALLLPETPKNDAFIVAERLRRVVRAHFADDAAPLTVSIGVASYPEDGLSADALLLAGDQALYSAKEMGRDRTVLFDFDTVAELMGGGGPRAGREQLSAVLVLAETIDLRDSGTARHAQAVALHAEAVARQLGLAEPEVERVKLAGLLHDVGKVGVRDAVLNKPGPLTEAEWAEMRTHPELGARILAGAHLEDVAEWVFAHHERLDGNGYPLGLRADEIPLQARILSVVDAYEAMTSQRPYSDPMPREHAEAELLRCAGTQFDPHVVRALIDALDDPQGSVGANVEDRAAPALAATMRPTATSSRRARS